MNGTASPTDQLSYPSSTIVTCNAGHTTVAGDPYGAATYSVSCGSDGKLSYTSVSCAPFSDELFHHCVSDGTHCAPDTCCAGYVGSGGQTFPCADADPSNHGCETSRNMNMYNASNMKFSNLAYDLMTKAAPETVDRTGELRVTEALWYGGKAYDLLLQSVDDDGNVVTTSTIVKTFRTEQVFSLVMDHNTEQNVRFSLASTGTTNTVTMPEMTLTLLDIDCHNDRWSICETIVTEDHDEYIKGEQVNVIQNGSEILAHANSHLNGEGNPQSTDLTDEQKDHALTLVFPQQVVVDHQICHRQRWRLDESHYVLQGSRHRGGRSRPASSTCPRPPGSIPPTECAEAPSCVPVSCLPEARANSTPSPPPVWWLLVVVETWTCKQGVLPRRHTDWKYFLRTSVPCDWFVRTAGSGGSLGLHRY